MREKWVWCLLNTETGKPESESGDDMYYYRSAPHLIEGRYNLKTKEVLSLEEFKKLGLKTHIPRNYHAEGIKYANEIAKMLVKDGYLDDEKDWYGSSVERWRVSILIHWILKKVMTV